MQPFLSTAKGLAPLQLKFQEAPHDAQVMARIARFFANRGMYPGAITHMQQALGTKPDHAPFHRELGKYYNQVGRNDEALYHLRRSIALNPKDANALRLLGAALCSVKQIDVAIRIFTEASSLLDRQSLTFALLAKAHYEQGDFQAAVRNAEQAVRLRNNNAKTILANAYCQVGDFEKAVLCAKQVVKANPCEGYGLLAIVLGRANLVEKSADACRRGLKLQPRNPQLHFLLAWSLLTLGDYDTGWEEYEWRLKSHPTNLDEGKFRAPLTEAMWNGEDLRGKNILVHGEQGFGDNIQFIRYIKCLAQLEANVTVLTRNELVSLFSQIPGVSRCGGYMEMMPRYDYHVVVGSLPRKFTRHIREIPREVPYLTAPKKPDRWFGIKRLHHLNVGICWGGNKLGPDDWRAVDIETFADLFTMKNVDFYSLQVGPKAEEIQPYLNGNVTDVSDRLRDFSDTAAVLERLDVLVTVDSGIAHLGGALGRKVFILLPFSADWRWLENDRRKGTFEITPWYPTMRLFRQATFGEWRPVIENLKKALTVEAEGKLMSLKRNKVNT